MVSLVLVFWIFVVLFAIVGGIRGWARELVVVFSVILAMFLLTVMENYVPWVKDVLPNLPARSLFWIRSMTVIVLAFFGYQTPTTIARIAERTARVGQRVQDWMLGLIVGGINGYLIVGSIWYYMTIANYPFDAIKAPGSGDPYYELAISLAKILAPAWLGTPEIYFAVGLAFVFVIVVLL